VLTAVATIAGRSVTVVLSPPDEGEGEEEAGAEEEHLEVPESDLNPIAPELKEMAWGFGAFVVFALLMRFFLYPRLKAGTDARYALIREGHEEADRLTDGARSDVARYETQLAAVKAEAQQRIEAARATLEGERSERLADVNARTAEKRAAAATEVEAARAAVQSDVEAAVRTVAARAGELATGRAPDDRVVAEAVAEVIGAGVAR
jgi:F-type H+-transporting ATPase subunit b